MFFQIQNIGGKIKCLSSIIGIIGIAFSVICGLITLIAGIADLDSSSALAGFILLVFGTLLSWVSWWVLYGLGQLIENSDRIVEAEENKQDERNKEQNQGKM